MEKLEAAKASFQPPGRAQKHRHRFTPGCTVPCEAEASAAEAVRKACRSVGALQEAFQKFAEEAGTLAQALELVADKLRLLCVTEGPVAQALAENPGAQERLLAALVARLEGFRAEGLALHSRFEKQQGSLLKQSQAALRLWQNRRQVGAAGAFRAGGIATRRRVSLVQSTPLLDRIS
ncbi:unnamed protein product [Effrenium voratum]|nr:unnamed protein product [Effrenium voratum]